MNILKSLTLKLALALGLLLAVPAQAQCTKDTECKGDRICEAGRCAAPTKTATTQPDRLRWSAGLGFAGMSNNHHDQIMMAPLATIMFDKGHVTGVAEFGFSNQITCLALGIGLATKMAKWGSFGAMILLGPWEGTSVDWSPYTNARGVSQYSRITQQALVWVQPFIRWGSDLSLIVRPRLGFGRRFETDPNETDRAEPMIGFSSEVAYRW